MSFFILLMTTKMGWILDYFIGVFIAGIIASNIIQTNEHNYKSKRIIFSLLWPWALFKGFIRMLLK